MGIRQGLNNDQLGQVLRQGGSTVEMSDGMCNALVGRFASSHTMRELSGHWIGCVGPYDYTYLLLPMVGHLCL
jgi:hypothetical protein